MRFIRFGQVIVICVLFAGVVSSATQAQDPKEAAEYWPFAEGNTWSFETTVQDKKITQVATVTKTSVVDGKTRAELEYKSDGTPTQKEIYESDGKTISRLASGS